MSERGASAPNSAENNPRREKLSDEELGNLLAAFGNHEAKAITFLLMRDQNIYTSRRLHKAFIDAQGDQKAWLINHRGPFEYCSESLSPIGLVTKETLNPDLSTYGYQITEYGREIGIPLCGLLLDFSRRHNTSLQLLLSSSNSPSNLNTNAKVEFKKRAPMMRLKIFYELITSPNLPLREADLVQRLGESVHTSVSVHLQNLSRDHFLIYQALEPNSPRSMYKLATSLPEGNLSMYRQPSTLVKNVIRVLQSRPNEYLAQGDIWALLPEEQKEGWKKESLLAEISRILAHLKRDNYAEVGKFHVDKQSEINLTDDQRSLLREFLDIIDRFQNSDSQILEMGRRLAENIIIDVVAVSDIVRRAREASPNANGSSANDIKSQIVSFIFSKPGITHKEIQALLDPDDKRLGIGRINQLTLSLAQEGEIKVSSVGSVKKFFPQDSN